MVAVMALVSEPRWNWSLTVTGMFPPYLRTPTAPTATRPLLVTMAPASAGRSYFWRSGSSSAFRFSGVCCGGAEDAFGVPARANIMTPRAYTPMLAVVMARSLGLDFLSDRLGLREQVQIVRTAGFGIGSRHVEAAEGMRADHGSGALTVDIQVANV